MNENQKDAINEVLHKYNGDKAQLIDDYYDDWYRAVYLVSFSMSIYSDKLYKVAIKPDELVKYLFTSENANKKIKIPIELYRLFEMTRSSGDINWEDVLLSQHATAFYNNLKETSAMNPDFLFSLKYSPIEIAKFILGDYEVQYPEIKEGDIVVSVGNSCDIRHVEGADEECILLVNGKQDKSYILPKELDKFWSEWRILCKKENREDV
jgi:hypothetical protein